MHFDVNVREAFSFLERSGFQVVESNPTLVLYILENIKVDVYWGRQSYEIGAGVCVDGKRFSLGEIVQLVAPELIYRLPCVTTETALLRFVSLTADLLKEFGAPLLRGDRIFMGRLEQQRLDWGKTLAVESLAHQLRPKAEEAFRRKDYASAADLYGRLRPCLTPLEHKKLALAESRVGRFDDT